MFISILIYAASGILYAQSNEENSVRTSLNSIMELSKGKSYTKLATLIAYKGSDKSREFKTTYDPTDKNEINEVQRIGKKIAALINLSDGYKIDKLESTKINGLPGYNITVGFSSGSQTLSTNFEFIKLPKGYVLYDMN